MADDGGYKKIGDYSSQMAEEDSTHFLKDKTNARVRDLTEKDMLENIRETRTPYRKWETS